MKKSQEESKKPHGQKRISQVAGLIALGVSVGMTGNASAKAPPDNVQMTKEIDKENLNVNEKNIKKQQAIKTEEKLMKPDFKLKTDGPPPP
jgi:hypothetical protein